MAKNKKNKALEALNITLPTKWAELNPHQVSRVAYYLSLRNTEIEFLVLLGLEFADLKPRGSSEKDGEIRYHFYHRHRGNVVLTPESITAIAEALKWIIEEPDPMESPEIEGYIRPNSQLYGVSLEQFVTADVAYAAYIRLSAPEALNTLVATLYLSQGKFNPEKLGRDAIRLGYLPEWQRCAVFLWFTGVKKMLAKKYPYVFSGDVSESFTPGDEFMMGLLSSLNDGKVADNERIKAIEVHEALFELNLKIGQSKKTSNG